MPSILVADDESKVREMLQWELGARGYKVVTARDGDEALAALGRDEFDLVLADLRPDHVDGARLLHASKTVAPLTEVVLTASEANGAVEHALACVKSGAFGYIQKPFGIEDVVATLERARARRQLRVTSALYQMSRVILDAREPHRLPQVIVGVAMEAMRADDVALMMPGHDDRLYVTCSRALTDSIRAEVHAAISPSVIERGPMLREPLVEFAGNVQSIVYPLCLGERLVGVLAISRVVNTRPFSKLDLEKAAVIASQTLLALENMRLVRQVVAAERLATVGQVATSIAHEVNNPIAYVLASHHQLRERLVRVVELCSMISAGDDAPALRAAFERAGGHAFLDELVQAAEDVREGATRVRDILHDTRALALGQDDKPRPFDVNEAIRSALRVVAAELRHRAEITTFLAERLVVLGSPGRLSQVLVNLLVNAGEAFSVRAGNAIVVTSKRVGGHVVLTIADNGPGIVPEALPRIFETFYTTKAAGGTGLGLPISRDIIRSHGGEISVDSTPGVGTTFTIVLPHAAAARTQVQTTPPPIEHDRPRLRLLFVDDEPNLLRAYKRGFGNLHDVTAVSSGKEALASIEANPSFDLIVCDLSMPQMSGMQLYQIVRERVPALAERFVFATGGATQRQLEEFLGSIANRVLEKPFDMNLLREMLDDLLRVA